MDERVREPRKGREDPGTPVDRSLDALAEKVIQDSLQRPSTDGSPTPNGALAEPDLDGGTPVSDDGALPRTPPDRVPVPQPEPDEEHDLSQPEYYLNRELTWLNFNFRVLHEAEDDRTPLLERVKFLSIVGSNLDEFFMKRIGGLKQQVGAGVLDPTIDGRTPEQQIEESSALVRDLELRARSTLVELVEACRAEGIEVTEWEALDESDQSYLREHYFQAIYPLLTPQATDPAHPFPFVSNLSLNLLVTLHYPEDPRPNLARVKVPVGPGVPRFLKLETGLRFVRLEDVMVHNLDLLFPGMEIERCDLFRVTRNANTELEEEEADDLLELIETGLRMRKFAPVVRLEVARGILPSHRGMLAAELGLDEQADVFEVDGLLGLADLMELATLEISALRDPPHHPVDHPALALEGSIFHTVREAGSVLLHHPYESFETSVERFVREASQDPKVLAIKMTLYRTSEDSKILGYLLDAARNGKQVAVVMELKARFDEAANIRWANRLGAVGIHVTYGVVGLKTHCKAVLVVRRDYYGIKRYAHIGTGNYHAKTARLYSDLGQLTSDDAIGADLTELFNYLTTGYKPNRRYRKLLPSPKLFKRALLEKIEREMEHHANGGDSRIQFKMNALEDPDVTAALYRAAQAGVKVDLIIRDTCRLRPGIPGLSESVEVVSIVGRFLEHARVYYFRNGGEEEYFIGSADCMSRNLTSRVEIVAPVEAEALRESVRMIFDTQLADQRCAWDMQSDGSYIQRRGTGKKARGSQQLLIEQAEKAHKEATRLRRRRPRGIQAAPKEMLD